MNPNDEVVVGAIKATPPAIYSAMYFADRPIEWWTTLFTFVYIVSLLIHFYWTKVLRDLFAKLWKRVKEAAASLWLKWKAWRES